MSFDLARFERLHADVLFAADPARALERLAPADRALFAGVDPDGLEIEALLIARLRFERLIHGSRTAAEWFERDGRAFTSAFRLYHATVPPTAVFPAEEARGFERWLAES